MSKHFKVVTTGLAILAILLFGLYRWVPPHLGQGVTPLHPALVLPKNDKELVTYNEKTHTLTVITSSHTVVEYAKDPKIELRKNGEVVISRHLTGFETDLFLGIGYSDTPRVFLGANLFHFSRFDANASLAWTADNHYTLFRPYLGVGYNLYSNTSFNIGFDPLSAVQQRADICGFMSIKF